jgi:hypothetical protein
VLWERLVSSSSWIMNMPRRPRFCPADIPVHVDQRGNNCQVCFAKDADMAAYTKWLSEYAENVRNYRGQSKNCEELILTLTPITALYRRQNKII